MTDPITPAEDVPEAQRKAHALRRLTDTSSIQMTKPPSRAQRLDVEPVFGDEDDGDDEQ